MGAWENFNSAMALWGTKGRVKCSFGTSQASNRLILPSAETTTGRSFLTSTPSGFEFAQAFGIAE